MSRPLPSNLDRSLEPESSASPHGHVSRPKEGRRRVVIEAIQPEIDGGQYAAKRVVGDHVSVSADLIADGHDVLAGEVLVRRPIPVPREGPAEAMDERVFAVPLELIANDRYGARFEVDQVGRWHYGIRAWVDAFATWRRGLSRKVAARASELGIDLLVGAELVRRAAKRAGAEDGAQLASLAAQLESGSTPEAERAETALGAVLEELMLRHPDRSFATRDPRWLPLWVDRCRARFSSWYEMFPRSTGEYGQHGTFESALAQLPYVAGMGFDVLYLPPIHPIGKSFRKGKNNTPAATDTDVGSPWAIGSADGGHKSIHPALGTLEQFERFAREASRQGLELALDIALQASPDHPYVREHPQWFKKRPDGSIQYAENPPKKYQDIYPFDFECEDWWSLWLELESIFEFWIARGVRIFRVDNPHTKSLAFWRWCLADLSEKHPDLIFLAEAFTRPKLMYLLAKVGFTQSYTYFTWRNTADELSKYMREIGSPPVSDFFRPNFWTNTPDILPEHLQHAGRASFSLRLVLAAMLSSNYGIYGPAFELLESVPRPGAEEYLDNEKYELKAWDTSRADSLRPLIRRINAIRRGNAALQQNSLSFHRTDNELLFAFSKHSADGSNSVLVVVNMDVHHVQSGWVELDFDATEGARRDTRGDLQLHDLLSDARYFTQGRRLFVRLDPGSAPAHIFRLRQRARTEQDFDYFI